MASNDTFEALGPRRLLQECINTIREQFDNHGIMGGQFIDSKKVKGGRREE